MATKVNESDTQYIFDIIKKICTEVGPGIANSKQESDRADILKEELAKVCDSVEVEEFSLSPMAFLGWFRMGCALAILSVVLFYLRDASPLILSFLSFLSAFLIIVITFFEFVLSWQFIDFLYKKGISQNVIGKIRPRGGGEARRILVFSGHHDSAVQFNWLTYTRYGYYLALFFISFGIISVMIATGVEFFSIALGFEIPGDSFFYPQTYITRLMYFMFPASMVSAFFFLGSTKNGGTVPGASDNLSGSVISLAVGRVLARHPELIPDDTEIRLISFGAEESGCRGARAYAKRHLDELKSKDARVCNMDTIYDPKIWIFTSDRNGTIKNSPEVVKNLESAAKSSGVPCRCSPFPFFGGGTDAVAFDETGIKAATLYSMKVPKQMVEFYHTPRDDYTLYENPAQREALENTLKMCVEWIDVEKGELESRS